jgi:hypothetical protein
LNHAAPAPSTRWIFQLDPSKPGGKGDQLDRPATRLVDGWVEIEAPDED